MKTYEVKIEKGTHGNFLNLRQLDDVKTIDFIRHDPDGNELYRLETSIDLDRELDLIEGVLEYRSGVEWAATIASVNPSTGEIIQEYPEMSPAEASRIIDQAHALSRLA
jgi:hypothetical protein